MLESKPIQLSEQECTKILNEGEFKFSYEEMLQIREFLSTLALIELEFDKQKPSKQSFNECDLLQEGQYRRAS